MEQRPASVRTMDRLVEGEGSAADDARVRGKTMTLKSFQRAVLTQDLPEEGLRAGDVGVIVEHHPPRGGTPEGYLLEFFAATGQTIALVSVPATAVRKADAHDVLCVREMARD